MTGFPWPAVAWDIDGTLVDSEPLHHRALLATCREQGLDLTRLPEETFIGVHLGDVWQMLRADLPAALTEAAFQERINHHYAAGAPGLAPIPGATEVIAALDRAGVVQVCASNSGRVVVDANLAALGVGATMRGTVSLDDVRQGKPAPEPYLRAAALAGLDPAEMLAVEDSLTGARAARAAGMRVVLLSPGSTPVAAEVDHPISHLTDLLHLRR